MKVLQYPLAKITIGFLTGILYAFYWQPNPNWIFTLLLFFLGILAFLFFRSKKIQKSKFYFSIFTYLTAVLTGMSSLIIQTDSFQKNNYSNFKLAFEKENWIHLVIREKLKSNTYNQRYIAQIQSINNTTSEGKILLHFPKKNFPNELETGTMLYLKGRLQPNKNPDNPMQFDYGEYLNRKQIYAQLYADATNTQISTKVQKDIWFYAAQIRSRIIHNLVKTDFEPSALAVATALILGQRQEIAPEIIHDYQYAGAIHILSVSGLHVGFIFLFLNFLLKPFPNNKRGAFIKLTIILGSLLLFAITAGLSASIVRSVTMFSFIAIGLFLRRSVNIYHTLLVSMLLILLFQPYFLFDIGFQLSYLAVFFIVWFQPVLASFWEPKNKIAKYCWDILTVSFAAQIGTLPLSLYYFHQFPGLFFITNLIVIPLVSIIMFWGVVVMSLAATGFTAFWMTKPLEWLIILLNKIINTIASFEQFIIKDIPFNFSLLCCSYLLIIATILWLQKPHFNRFCLVLLSIISLQTVIIISNWQINNQQEWIVFNQKRKTLIVQRQGKTVHLYSNDTLVSKNQMLNAYLTGKFSHIQKQDSISHTAYFKESKILILDSMALFPKNIQPDIILLTQTPKINLDRILLSLQPKLVVADGSNYKNILKQWEESCKKQKIPFHATAEKGYFQLK